MDKRLQDAVFAELINRYGRFIFSLIRQKFEDEDAKDVFQDFSIFLHKLIGDLYQDSADLFDTKAWIRTVTNNFCYSEWRRRNAKRKVKFVSEEHTELARRNYADDLLDVADLFKTQEQKDLIDALDKLLYQLPKRDALMLKMKYYYGKPSHYISQKLNETHVDVYISRLKDRIKRRTGINNIDQFLEKYNTSIH